MSDLTLTAPSEGCQVAVEIFAIVIINLLDPKSFPQPLTCVRALDDDRNLIGTYRGIFFEHRFLPYENWEVEGFPQAPNVHS